MQFLNVTKKLQNMLKSGFGKVLGSIWERFGALWGVFWPLMGDFCSFFFYVPNHAIFMLGSTMDSKTPFGSILGGSWKIWGGFGEGLGRNFEGFGCFCVGFGQILDAFGKMCPCYGKAYNLDPRADPRSVTMRGGPIPQRVSRWTTLFVTVLMWEGFAPSWEGYAETVVGFVPLLVGTIFRFFSHFFARFRIAWVS